MYRRKLTDESVLTMANDDLGNLRKELRTAVNKEPGVWFHVSYDLKSDGHDHFTMDNMQLVRSKTMDNK